MQKPRACVHANLDPLCPNATANISEYIPTMLSVYGCDIHINNVTYALSLTDTSGNKLNKKLVQLKRHYYDITPDIDVILMCFSMVDPVSFSNVSKRVRSFNAVSNSLEILSLQSYNSLFKSGILKFASFIKMFQFYSLALNQISSTR